VGGGGGSGGSAMTFEFSNADIVPEIPVLDDISGLTTLEMTLQGSGGAGGDGGDVTLNSTGDISTSGDFAMGVVAQSVAGGGGLAGFYNPQGVTNNEIVNSIFNTFVDTEAGLSFAGSVGGAGTAGHVIVNHTGNIWTLGDGAHGLFAQSVAGQGAAGDVDITLNGSISASGDHAYGIYAQSGGSSGNGNITITINEGGMVMGGTGTGAGIVISGGAVNSLFNVGTITSVPGVYGRAIVSNDGNETINNYGTITGSLDLGAGSNAFNNLSGGRLNAGAIVNLGAGNTLNNHGTLSLGGVDQVMATTVTGNLVQTSTGTYVTDVDFKNAQADRLDVSGTSSLDGKIVINPVNGGSAAPGSKQFTIVSSAGGVVDKSNLALSFAPSAVTSYQLLYPNLTDVVLSYNVDYDAPSKRGNFNRNRSAFGQYVNAVQRAGGSEDFASIAAMLVLMPDDASLGNAFDQLSPEPLLATSTSAAQSDLRFADALHSCRVREGEFRFVSEGECSWFRLNGSKLIQDRTDSNMGFDREANTFAAGAQKKFDENWYTGFGFSIDTSTLHFADTAKSDGSQFSIGLIAKRNEGAAAYSASIDVGYGYYHSTRVVNLPVPGTIAVSDQNVGLVSAHARMSHDYEHENIWYLRPLIDAGFTYVYHGSFNEQGAGAANLNVESGDNTLVSLQPGLELGREFATAGGTLIRPFGMIGITQYLSGTTPGISASLQGSPVGTTFTVESEMDKTYADLDLGVDILSAKGTTFRVNYSGQFSENSEFHSCGLKLSVPF